MKVTIVHPAPIIILFGSYPQAKRPLRSFLFSTSKLERWLSQSWGFISLTNPYSTSTTILILSLSLSHALRPTPHGTHWHGGFFARLGSCNENHHTHEVEGLRGDAQKDRISEAKKHWCPTWLGTTPWVYPHCLWKQLPAHLYLKHWAPKEVHYILPTLTQTS